MVILTGKCSSTADEAIRSGTIANTVLSETQKDTVNNNERLCRKQLQLLVQRISYDRPHFSAAGFFTVDYSVICTTFGIITSYFIIFLQFGGNSTCNCSSLNNTTM